MRDTMATKKKRKAMILASVCSSEDARVTSWSEHAQCVRAARESVRAVELVRVRSIGEYPSDVVGYEMRYGLHVTSNDRARPQPPLAAPAVHPPCVPSARQMRAIRATFRQSRQATFRRPLQAATAEYVGNNAIQT